MTGGSSVCGSLAPSCSGFSTAPIVLLQKISGYSLNRPLVLSCIFKHETGDQPLKKPTNRKSAFNCEAIQANDVKQKSKLIK